MPGKFSSLWRLIHFIAVLCVSFPLSMALAETELDKFLATGKHAACRKEESDMFTSVYGPLAGLG